MELKINGTIKRTVIIKGEVEAKYKVIEEKNEDSGESKWAILTTHIDEEKNEVLDFFAYLTKEKIENLLANVCEEAKQEEDEIINEENDDDEKNKVKHYIFTDEGKTITYEDDYSSIDEAQAFCDLLIKQFGKKFTYYCDK